jgi:glyoxylase-like metal-dependent hydrolase (beta-lactamase superfamily II)
MKNAIKASLLISIMSLVSIEALALEAKAIESQAIKESDSLSLTIFECGRGEAPDRSFWSPGVDINVKHSLVASCYLIRHPDGLMVWDTGIPAFVAQRPNGLSVAGGKINYFLETPFPQQLKSQGISPGSIQHLGISHMHPDHAGNANAFSNANWYVQQAEYDAAFGPDASKFNFIPKTYQKLKDGLVTKLNGHHDVFGDGSVMIIPAPGHTPGHQVLLVRLPSGPVLLSGDLWHFNSNKEHSRIPGFNFDQQASRNSMTAINSLLAVTGAKLLIQHDVEQNSSLPHAPKSLD